jgi:hypothetical protein
MDYTVSVCCITDIIIIVNRCGSGSPIMGICEEDDNDNEEEEKQEEEDDDVPSCCITAVNVSIG